MSRWIVLASVTAVLASGLDAQSLVSDPLIRTASFGLPPEPPLLTLLEMASPGRLAVDPEILPRGDASEILHEEIRVTTSPGGPAGEVMTSVRMKFDEQGRITQRIEKQFNAETTTAYGYEDDRLVGAETTTRSRVERRSAMHWAYDALGRLSEFRTTQGTETFNHELDYRYDERGRRLSFEFRQGAKDDPFSRTDITYSDDGMTVVVTKTYVGTKIVDRSTRTLDDQGRVVRVILDSEGREPDHLARDIRLRYDEKDRLIEQTTEAIKFSDTGAEHDLPPGMISIAYHDGARQKRTRYTAPDGETLESLATRDDRGATIGYTLTDAPLRGAPRVTSMKLDCLYDRLGNWTACDQIREENEESTIVKRFRRTITYRN